MKKLTLRELASRIGVSPTYLSSIETGCIMSPPTVVRLEAIARELDVDKSDILLLAGRTADSLKIDLEGSYELRALVHIARDLTDDQLDHLLWVATQLSADPNADQLPHGDGTSTAGAPAESQLQDDKQGARQGEERPLCKICGGAQWATNQRYLCNCRPSLGGIEE